MTNKFTLENTKDATHVYFSEFGIQFEKVLDGNLYYINGATDFKWSTDLFEIETTKSALNLTDQTDRGYPTLEWFLGCGFKLEAGDFCIDTCGTKKEILTNSIARLWNAATPADRFYVEYTNDNRHDLTTMARDEYYANRKNQWPDNSRIDAIGQNGNNGEHYPHESESPLGPNFESKPVYTQEMCDNGELPPVGSDYLDGDNQLCTSIGHTSIDDIVGEMKELVSGIPYAAISVNKLNEISPIDTRTDEDKLRDAIRHELVSCRLTENVIDNLMDKFTITLNEEG